MTDLYSRPNWRWRDELSRLGFETARVAFAALVIASLIASTPVGAQQDEAAQATPEPEEEEDVYAGQAPSAYNPETAVFGPLPRYKTEDGNLNIGVSCQAKRRFI